MFWAPNQNSVREGEYGVSSKIALSSGVALSLCRERRPSGYAE